MISELSTSVVATLDVTGKSTWNVFPHGTEVKFDLELANVTDKPQKLDLSTHWQQKRMPAALAKKWTFTLAPGKTTTIAHAPMCRTFGKYDYVVTLRQSSLGELMTHRTTFARLPQFADARLSRDNRSRFGIWWWDGTHRTPPGGVGVDVVDWLGITYAHRFLAYAKDSKIADEVHRRGMRPYHEDADRDS